MNYINIVDIWFLKNALIFVIVCAAIMLSMIAAMNYLLNKTVYFDDGKKLAENGIKCPRCNSDQLLGGVNFYYPLREPDDSYKIRCRNCKYEWEGIEVASKIEEIKV
ncbi:MAG: hypothetical protein V3T98_00450 [Candidatus Paceibacterota bacterium]